MHKFVMAMTGLGLGVATLSGCWEDTDVTIHEPGAYKGPADPLLAQDAGARESVLKERFQMVQTDR